jgi:S-DNA-T family DNA segregation ATPase FtsK/SpoIIIE
MFTYEELVVKEKKGRVSLIAGLVCLVGTLLVGSVVVLPLLGIDHSVLSVLTGFLGNIFSFSAEPTRFGLAPLAFLLLVWTIMIFSFRGKKRFSFLLIPVTALMAYTLYTLSHMMQGSSRPLFVPLLLSSSVDVRAASFKVLLAFLGETALFVAVTLIGDALDRYHQHKAERQRLREEMRLKSLASAPTEERQERKQKKRKQRKQRQEERDEEETVVLSKKPVEPEHMEEGNSFSDSQTVHFPPIADVPPLESLSRKSSSSLRPASKNVIEVEEIKVNGVVSIGALHALTEERKRNNGLSYLERKQQELAEKKQEREPEKPKKENVQLSGFLQGALEAVGKAPQKISSRRSDSSGKARGMLAQAVEQNQSQSIDEPLSVKERILSVQYEKKPESPLFAAPEAATPTRVPEPVVTEPKVAALEKPQSDVALKSEISKPAFFSPMSTANPINGGELEGSAPQGEPEEETDLLEVSSGVGGLSSALISKGRLSYAFPDESMLVTYPKIGDVVDEVTLKRGEVLVSTLQEFNIAVDLTNIVRGPTVTMFELLPAPGVRVNSIVNLSDNIALALAATQVRIVAPIPGKSAVGVEIPNLKRDIIGFREMLPSLSDGLGIPMVLGRNLMGQPIVVDVVKAPHLLIAGSTGSGKSVCVNSLICSVLFRRSPKQVRMILVDPKIVELNIYNGIPHLLTPVITEAKRTLKALDFCLYEMDRRYKLLQGINVRNIVGYNEKIETSRLAREKLPYILVVIDEFADLMHLVGKDMESKVSRLAAMSRAVGIHLVLATQRPSVDVITGVIKNNIPTRIAFAVTSTTDSRIILDEQGADKLLGKGDMLYMSSSNPAAERIQGSFLSDHEVEEVVRFVSSQGTPDFIDESFFEDDEPKSSDSDDEMVDVNDDSELMERALAIVVERKCASASYLQRRLKIGYNRAARLVEQMEELGYVGPPNGSKPRELIKYP